MRRYYLGILLLIALTAGIYLGYRSNSRPTKQLGPVLSVTFLSPTLGGGVLIKTPENRSVLIDPGPKYTESAVIDYLKKSGISSIILILTNPSDDRGSSIDRLAESFKIERILHSESPDNSNYFKTVTSETGRNILHGGDKVYLSKTTMMQIVSPQEGGIAEKSIDKDNNSLVTRLCFGNIRFLFTSDIKAEAEINLVKQGKDVQSDILFYPREINKLGASLELLSVVRPKYCIISTGMRDQSISRSFMTSISKKNTGAQVYRTDQDGSIEIITNGKSISANFAD